MNTILPKLEASRKELLDLGMRNPLLNYKLPSGRGLKIVQEKSASVYDILVRQLKAMSFISRATKSGNEEELVFDELSENDLQDSYTDTKLQTNESEKTLQTRLLGTYYAARTSLEEQGVNILYLALGLLKWYETETSEEARFAPLVLIPVTLERSSARERFRLRYSLEDTGANISLQAKMKTEFNITIPDLSESDDLDIEGYFDSIANAVSGHGKWQVESDAIELGFFSFAKFMIYNDLDNSKWPEHNKPINHPALVSLFEDGFRDEQPSVSEDSFLDTETVADSLYQVVDADSSQLMAVLAVNEGRNMVIQGPPGTGKSQTITNIIANAIGQGKKVLFVAEKMAALEVVKRRLDTIHLGEACLELHSHKANKKELHQELRRILELGKPTLHLAQEVVMLKKYKEELNEYCTAVNTLIGNSGLTPQKVAGCLLNISAQSDQAALPRLELEAIETWDAERMKKAEALAERVQVKLANISVPAKLVFWGSELRVLFSSEEQRLAAMLKQAKDDTDALRHHAEQVSAHIGLPVAANKQQTLKLTETCRLLSGKPDLADTNVSSNAWLLNAEDIKELLEAGSKLFALRDSYKDAFMPEIWEQDVLEMRKTFAQHGDKWYKFLIGAYGKSKKQLAMFCKIPVPKQNSMRLKFVDDVLESKRLESILKEHEILAQELYTRKWKAIKSDWKLFAAINEYMAAVHLEIANELQPKDILSYLAKNEKNETCVTFIQTLTDALSHFDTVIAELTEGLQLNETTLFSEKNIESAAYIDLVALLSRWIDRLPDIHQAIEWNNLTDLAAEETLTCLTKGAVNWPEAHQYLKLALQKTWYEYLYEQAITASPALRKFSRDSHEEVAKQFRKMDELNFQYNVSKVAQIHWDGMPKLEAAGQVNVLRTEFNKKVRHMPIRKLMMEAGHAIQAVKPVFMMSPISIANFLPPGIIDFDLVIFDEASQVRPVDALGAILRGKQLVVVGDTKQLPPTSFFDSLSKETDDEDNVTSDLQSILGMCDAQGAPQGMLRWHYRSRHESLISLSNHQFYENKLVIFPSPGSRHRMGLVYHQLKDTVYDRGKTRTNPKEAERVADAVVQHALNYPKLTLGVVAFSTAQRQAIQDALELRRREHPEIESFFRNHPHEPFFVKNLENVQGDERDVIFISIGYGKTQDGYVSMSFGPLNNEGGERRLNVLITRAKLRCEVFTNLSSDDIDISKTKRSGIVSLKHFLYFAQHGKLNITEETGRPTDSPFEDQVAATLEKQGYIVRKQIGSQGFFIDLAVVDPENPGRYLLGIECDGAAYHSSRSARDRDRLRQQILEGIGWRMHRIWSTDWFRNPERELKRVIAAIERAKELAMLEDQVIEEEVEELLARTLVRQEADKDKITIPYTTAILSHGLEQIEITAQPIGKLVGWIEEIVKTESPVHFDEMAKRIIDAAGVTRIGSKIKEVLRRAVEQAEASQKVSLRGDFLWIAGMDKPILRDRSAFATPSKKIKYIAPEEIGLAIGIVVKESIAIEPEAALVHISRLLGFNRVTQEMKNDLLALIGKSLENKTLVLEGEYLKLNPTSFNVN